MANIDVAVEQLSPAGIDLTDTGSLSTGNTYLIPNDGNVFLHIKKSGAGSCIVTVATPGNVDGNVIADLAVTVAATTGDKMIGPFKPEVYNDGNGKLNVTFSEVTGLTIAAARVAR